MNDLERLRDTAHATGKRIWRGEPLLVIWSLQDRLAQKKKSGKVILTSEMIDKRLTEHKLWQERTIARKCQEVVMDIRNKWSEREQANAERQLKEAY